MSIVLKSERGDFIYFDVVTSYTQTFQSQVTQHPVDGSGTVSDQVTKSNPIIKVRGFISGADFNSSKPPELSVEDRQFIGLDQVVVSSDIASIIEVKSEDSFTNLLPDVAGQFFTDKLPQIENLSENRESTYYEKILFGILLGFQVNKARLSIFEFDKGLIVEEIADLFITNLTESEKAESGDALEIDVTLERVTFSTLMQATVETTPAEGVEAKTEPKVDKGNRTGSESEDTVTDTERDSTLRRGLDIVLGRT